MANLREDVHLLNTSRYELIEKEFVRIFGEMPEYFIRAPGRVNLIGEHIDYCGYAVLPMAIEQDVIIAISKNNDLMLRIYNTDSKYQKYLCQIQDITLSVSSSHLKWHHYFLCGWKGIVDSLKVQHPVGMNALVSGNVPQNAGVSSSSALVCSVALSTAHCNKQILSKENLCEITAKCETYLGLDDGGMDQAIAFLAEPGIAKLIEFHPTRSTDVKLPREAVFVVSNSCVEINKAATSNFNMRVAESRLAAQVMAKKQNLNWQEISTLKQLQETLRLPLHTMTELVKSNLHKMAYSKDEICHLLNITAEQLNCTSLTDIIQNVKEFKLFDRAMHVFEEAGRVLKFKTLCDEMAPNVLEELGKVMYESHESCRDLYECSCPELEELIKVSRKAGAHGSRLTGAGWGGCTVSLVSVQNVHTFIQQMKTGYYENYLRKPINLSEAIFATSPGDGAKIIKNIKVN